MIRSVLIEQDLAAKQDTNEQESLGDADEIEHKMLLGYSGEDIDEQDDNAQGGDYYGIG